MNLPPLPASNYRRDTLEKAALALHFVHYNFCRVHGSLRITPVMAAGITDRLWTVEEPIAA